MHVGIDLRVLDRKGMDIGGLGRYGLEMAIGLAAARPSWRLTLHGNRPEFLPPDLRPHVHSTRWPTGSGPGRVAWLQAGAALDVTARSADVWFSPSFVLPLWRRRPSVVAIHDLSFLLLPERYRGRANARYAATATRASARRATRIVCGAEATRQMLEHRLGVDPSKVDVVRYGVSDVFYRTDEVAACALAQPPYLLAVGTFEARKGLEILYSAVREVNRAGTRVRLVLAGQPGWGTETLIAGLARDRAVDIRTRVSDAELAALYHGALALVYPSRMEGFGLPVAEAMAARCPVIASDLACIREYAGGAVLYAPVGDATVIAEHVDRLLDDPDEAVERVAAGSLVARDLRWSAVAERTARVIERAGGDR